MLITSINWGKEAIFELTKNMVVKGKVTGIETDFVVIEFDETPLGLGQGSQVTTVE